jgi:hypothetical protein
MRFFSEKESDRFADMLTRGCYCEDNRRAMKQQISNLHYIRHQRQMRQALMRMAELSSRPPDGGGGGDEELKILAAQLSQTVGKIKKGGFGKEVEYEAGQ